MGREKLTTYTFFLGGYDAEMCEIRNLLEAQAVPFVDKHLHWGAKASAYQRELEQVQGTPVLIELEIDIPLPPNAKIIDHHGEEAGKDAPTSIEQVAELLGITLNRWQQLIAANDRGWIDALKAMGATQAEIEQVRRYDRQCQGVTDEEEQLAEEAIRHLEVVQGIAVVRIPFTHISPVTDRLYGKYNNMLIITPESINFSGEGKLVMKLAQAFPDSWYGGNLPEKGFWGSLKLNNLSLILKIIGD